MSLRKKIILTVISIIFFFGALATGAVFFYAKNSLIENKKEELKNLINAQSFEISQILKSSVGLAETISKQNFIISYLNGDRNPQAEEILARMKQYNIDEKYSAIYLLDLSGKALVSTDASFVGENYSFRNYFKKASQGGVAIENALGVTSREMGYYFAAPVQDGNSNVLGVVVVKMNVSFINKALDRVSLSWGKMMFTDELGVIIYSNVRNRFYKTLGVLEEEKMNLLKEERKYENIEILPLQYDMVQQRMPQGGGVEIFEMFDEKDGENELLGAKKIENYPFYLVIEEEYEEYINSAITVSLLLGIAILLAVLGAGIILSILITRFLKPLEFIEEAAVKITEGKMQTRIDESRLNSELRKLANAFNIMVASVVKSREEVDKKVGEQVIEIKEKNQEIENQQKATINILEDVNNSQEELKLRYKELDIIKSLNQKLGVTLEEQSVMKNIVLALQNIFPEAVFSYVIFPINKERLGKEPNIIHVYSLKETGRLFLEKMQEKIKLGIGKMPLYLKKRDHWSEWIKLDFVMKMNEGARIGKQKTIPLSYFDISIVVPNALAGLISISSESDSLLNDQKNIDVIKRIIENGAQTVERLKALVTSEHSRLQDLVESMRSAVVMFDESGRVVVVNSSAKEIFGATTNNFSLENIFEFIRQGKNFSKGVKDLEVTYTQAIKNNKTQKIDSLEINRRFYELIISPVNDFQKEVSGGVIILHDITHLKEIDRMKTEFVSVASHQLRTPLTAINWYVEMLQSGDAGKLNKDQKSYLEEIYNGSVRMVKLVNELLNVSRLETGRLKVSPKLIYLDKLIENVIHEMDKLAEQRGCEINFNKPEKGLPKISVDETLIRQVIHNFITNALRYSFAPKSQIKVSIEEKGDEYLISVADQGIGIPKEAQSKIFQKFFRADNARKKEGEGSGIGMYISKMIMEASAGKVWFESPTLKKKKRGGKIEEYGTTFYATIPKKGMVAHEGEKGLAI